MKDVIQRYLSLVDGLAHPAHKPLEVSEINGKYLALIHDTGIDTYAVFIFKSAEKSMFLLSASKNLEECKKLYEGVKRKVT